MNYNDTDLIFDAMLVLGDTNNGDVDATTATPHYSRSISDIIEAKEHVESVLFLSYMYRALHSELKQSHEHLKTMKISTEKLTTATDGRRSNTEHLRGIDSLPLSLSCRELTRQLGGNSTSSSVKDSSLKQLRRDLVRDKLILNGERLSNAELDLEGISEKLGATIGDVVRISHLPPIEKSVSTSLAIEILRKASRTNSGFVSYQFLQHVLNTSKGATSDIKPLSNRAKPININVSVGNIEKTAEARGPHPQPWGLLITIQCSSFFQLTPTSSVDNPATVTATAAAAPFVVEGLYEHNLVLPFDVAGKRCSATSLNALEGKSGEDGIVTLRRLPN